MIVEGMVAEFFKISPSCNNQLHLKRDYDHQRIYAHVSKNNTARTNYTMLVIARNETRYM